MLNQKLKDTIVTRILPRIQTPAQYLGGELNMVRKDHRDVRGKLCLAFPDAYTNGMSHHGLQVLYTLMNNEPDWLCERAFTPWTDMEVTGESMDTNAERDLMIQKPAVAGMVGMFVGEGDPRDPLASPLHGDYHGLAPLYLQVGGDETLLDDSTRVAERAGQADAYLFLGFPWGLHDGLSAGIRHVGEYAGSRVALVHAIPALMITGDIQELIWPIPWQDVELIQLFQVSGYNGLMTSLDGHTLRIINFPGLMEDLRAILRARLRTNALRGLRFEQSGPLLGGIGDDRYTITRGSDRLELDGAAMTLLVMGDADPQAEPIRAPGALAEVISALFPLPSFLPGLNYH